MYRFILLFFLAQSISAGRWCNHHGKDYHGGKKDYHTGRKEYDRLLHDKDKEFHQLSWDIVALDRKIQRLCNINSDHLKETFYPRYYKLSVALPDYSAEEIKIQIKHRVIFVQAVKNGTNGTVFSELKILPEVVDPNNASWSFRDGTLAVDIMYKVPMGTEVVKVCNAPINSTVLDIGKSLDIDERFGEDDDDELPQNVS